MLFQSLESARHRLRTALVSRPWLAGAVTAASALAVLAIVFGFSGDAFARAGGGQSYSGGGYSGGGGGYSGGGGGDGGGELVVALIQLWFWLVTEHPVIGIPLTIFGVVAVYRWSKKQKGGTRGWDSAGGSSAVNVQALQRKAAAKRRCFQAIRAKDPAFSRAVFEDFVYFLYAEMQRARAKDNPALLPYAAPELIQSMNAGLPARPTDVSGIIIGGMTIGSIEGVGTGRMRFRVSIEANIVEETEANGQKKSQRWYVSQILTLVRSETAKSRAPDKVKVLGCPNCGAPFDGIRGGICSYCGQAVTEPGKYDWCVTEIRTVRKEPRGPLLTSDVEEVGTDLPTLTSPTVQQDMDALLKAHPDTSWEAISKRARIIWKELQDGWTERDEARIRPFVSDNLFQSMTYWLDMYRAQKCRNVSNGGGVTNVVLVSVESDQFYDLVTVRLYASGPDVTVSEDGRVLSGSRTKIRKYSEYWTLMRGRTSQGSKAPADRCPNCGGELKINMAGSCGYCGAKVTSGDFDWVLSRIEQDESYRG